MWLSGRHNEALSQTGRYTRCRIGVKSRGDEIRSGPPPVTWTGRKNDAVGPKNDVRENINEKCAVLKSLHVMGR